MKIVILAGGMQSTIVNESEGVPKPMARIGEEPILWHIMKSCAAQGYTDFIICGGYKVDDIKDYFMDFYIYQSDITVNLLNNTVEIHKKKTENWNVTVVDTGLTSSPGIRVLQVLEYIEEDNFFVVNGDCLSDISLRKLEEKHFSQGKLATLAVARPTGRYTILPIGIDGEMLETEQEDYSNNQAWINSGCQILNKKIIPYLEKAPDMGSNLFSLLSSINQIISYKHDGFWSAVETKRDYFTLINMWESGRALWKNWQD